MCSDIPGRLVEDPDLGVEGVLVMHGQLREDVEVQLAGGKLDVVDSFVYLGDCVCLDGCIELATFKNASLYGENLGNRYPCLKQFL